MLEQAKRELDLGKIISYPTETVYGLGVDPSNENAVDKLLEIKKRSSSISLIASSIEVVNSLPIIESDSSTRLKLQEKHWPGALTLILKVDINKISFSKKLLASDGSIAIRVSSSKQARELAKLCSGLITATSANPKDFEPAKSLEESLKYFPDIFALKREEGDLQEDLPSTIYSLISNKVLRQGVVKLS